MNLKIEVIDTEAKMKMTCGRTQERTSYRFRWQEVDNIRADWSLRVREPRAGNKSLKNRTFLKLMEEKKP